LFCESTFHHCVKIFQCRNRIFQFLSLSYQRSAIFIPGEKKKDEE